MSEIIGKIKELGETMTVGSAGTFRKRTLVVSTDEQYVQHVPIDFVQDKCEILNSYKAGENVKVSINIRGNEYNGKYYVSLNGWKIEKLATEVHSAPMPAAPAFAPATNLNEDEDSDLPF